MPIFTLHTTVCQNAAPPTLMSDLSQLLEKALDVPAESLAIVVHMEQQMTFGGTSDPCGVCTLQSIGKFGGSRNEKFSKVLCDFLSKLLNIPPDRLYITFLNVDGADVGWNNSTFAGVTF